MAKILIFSVACFIVSFWNFNYYYGKHLFVVEKLVVCPVVLWNSSEFGQFYKLDVKSTHISTCIIYICIVYVDI